MNRVNAILTFIGIVCGCCLMAAGPAWGTQTHGEPEGLYVHQMAHLFFMLSMVILIYWLRARGLTRVQGWRYIQYAAMLFILWNADTILVHYLDEHVALFRVVHVGHAHFALESQDCCRWLEILYYLAKLDHLICVPAMWLLYRGLKMLYLANDTGGSGEGRA